MTDLVSLWLPTLLSAVLVFIVSTIIHMFLKYHANDFRKVTSEDEVMESMRKYNIPPGDYILPFAGSSDCMKNEDFKEKLNKGPVAFMTVMPNGEWKMGSSMILWFVYSVVVSIFAAYVASRALSPGAHYLAVFRFVGATAFAGYALALLQNSIWYKRNWGATLKSVFDGFIYALVTAGAFGWLWPQV